MWKWFLFSCFFEPGLFPLDSNFRFELCHRYLAKHHYVRKSLSGFLLFFFFGKSYQSICWLARGPLHGPWYPQWKIYVRVEYGYSIPFVGGNIQYRRQKGNHRYLLCVPYLSPKACEIAQWISCHPNRKPLA